MIKWITLQDEIIEQHLKKLATAKDDLKDAQEKFKTAEGEDKEYLKAVIQTEKAKQLQLKTLIKAMI